MAGGLILCLCLGMLTLGALPTETAAHTNHRLGRPWQIDQTTWDRISIGPGRYQLAPGYDADNWDISQPPSDDIIQWIRVYKNPKTQSTTTLTRLGTALNTSIIWDFSAHGIRDLQTYLNDSYEPTQAISTTYTPPETNLLWVQFDPSTGELFEDPEKPGNSGLVTETEHTSVTAGDRIAIAIRVRGFGTAAHPDIAIGPERERTYETTNANGAKAVIIHQEREWRLKPNMPMRDHDPTVYFNRQTYSRAQYEKPLPSGYEHTLVYQFIVTAEHVALNNEVWLTQDWVSSTSYVRQGQTGSDPRGGGAPTRYESVLQGVHLLWGDSGVRSGSHLTSGVFPSATTLLPFNTFLRDDSGQYDSGVRGDKYTEYIQREDEPVVNTGWAAHRYSDRDDFQLTHSHPVLYDPAVKVPIYYPVIVAGESEQVVRIDDVPDAAVTGSFTVTLHFATDFGEVELFVGHDVSSGGVAALKAALIERLGAASPFEVVSLKYVGGIQTPASLATGARAAGTSTQYALTLEPRLGLKGDIALKTPVPTADELEELSASDGILIPGFEVEVPVDTSLRLAGDVVEPSGTYLAGDEVVVRVPFAADGLTYEGDEPPYITIYLGAQTDENRRHATWQRGDETPGSTVVPFVYVIDAEDPVASSVRADVNTFAVPAGTTLQTGSGLSLVGTAAAPMDSGEEAPAPSTDGPAGPVLSTPSGAPPPVTDTDVDVLPAFLLPSEEEPSEPKAAASGVPRTPIVFNELGNGNGETNDWLEFRNVTGSAVSLKDWELSVVQDGNKEDTSLIVFPDVSVPASGLLLITNSDPSAEGNMLAGGENKGLTHHYIVNAGLSLPDDGKFLLILRNAKEKLGLNEAFVDVAGGGGSGTDAFVRETTGDYDTHVWPLQVLEAPGGNTEDALSAGKVWLRAKADVVGYHKDAWGEAAFTGVGYDRMVSRSDATAGTPGYPNGAVKIEAATPRGALTFSEVMLDSAGGTLPQWIELYNSSKTDALNLERWKLEIQNVDSEDLVGRPVVTLTLEAKVIQPNQTLLIVAGNARASSADVFPADRVYNLLALHEKNLRIKSARDTFLSAKGFYLKLIDRNGNVVDEIGNTDGDRRTQDEPIWALPVLTGEEPRSSIIRRYSDGVVSDGASRFGWVLSANFKQFKTGEAVLGDTLYYGHADDVGSPGYRQGGALPVELSGFSVTREENGAVLLTWTTESEVDNAGFNVRRSLRRDSGYALLNPVLIAGAGTTGERQTYTFIDTSAKPGVEHYYQLEEVSLAGSPQTLVTRRLRGPVSPANRALKTLGEVKQVK